MQTVVEVFQCLVQVQEVEESEVSIYLTIATFSFIRAKSWGKPKCAPVRIWLINSGIPVHTMEYCLKDRRDYLCIW